MLKSRHMVPGCRPLIAIGYTYNAQKVLSFIVTEEAGITQSGITHLFKYPDQFYNVSIRPVANTIFMYKLFGSVNDVDPHNKSRQSYLALEKF